MTQHIWSFQHMAATEQHEWPFLYKAAEKEKLFWIVAVRLKNNEQQLSKHLQHCTVPNHVTLKLTDSPYCTSLMWELNKAFAENFCGTFENGHKKKKKWPQILHSLPSKRWGLVFTAFESGLALWICFDQETIWRVRVGREVQDGWDTWIPMADSYWCVVKTITIL